MPHLLDISQDTTAFPWAKRTPLAGIPTVAAMALALLLGVATGHESAGAIAAGAAFTVGFAVFHETVASTLLSMGLLTLGIGSATLAGSLAAERTWLVLLVVLIAALNYAVLSDLSPTAGWMGQQCGTFVIVASYFPMGMHYALGRTSMVLAGGTLQMLTTVLAQNLHAGRPQTRLPPLGSRLNIRVRELWQKLRTEVRPQDDTASYALRLALTLLLCTAIYRHYHVRNGYWSPMTALLVLKPQWTSTLSRGIARLAGTVAGAGIALLLAHTIPFNTPTIFLLVVVWAWGCYALQAVNYALFSLFITLYIVFLFRAGGFSQTSAAHIRLFNTFLGGSIALLMDGLWKLFPNRAAAASESGTAPHSELPSVQ